MSDLKCGICGRGWNFGEVHDREKERLKEDNKMLKDALSFYAKSSHWQDRRPDNLNQYYSKGEGIFYVEGDFIVCEGGELARKTLEKDL